MVGITQGLFPAIREKPTKPEQVEVLLDLWKRGIIIKLEFDGHLSAIANGTYEQAWLEDNNDS